MYYYAEVFLLWCKYTTIMQSHHCDKTYPCAENSYNHNCSCVELNAKDLIKSYQIIETQNVMKLYVELTSTVSGPSACGGG